MPTCNTLKYEETAAGKRMGSTAYTSCIMTPPTNTLAKSRMPMEKGAMQSVSTLMGNTTAEGEARFFSRPLRPRNFSAVKLTMMKEQSPRAMVQFRSSVAGGRPKISMKVVKNT